MNPTERYINALTEALSRALCVLAYVFTVLSTYIFFDLPTIARAILMMGATAAMVWLGRSVRRARNARSIAGRR